MPGTPEQTIAAADAISSGKHESWGNVHQWPADRIRSGDWSPVQWYDGELAEIAHLLENHRRLKPARMFLAPGPTGQAAQDSWKRTAHDEDSRGMLIFDSVSAKIRRTMTDRPEQYVVPGGRRAHLHERVLAGKGNLMLATRYDTVSGRLTALWSEQATFGFGWIPWRGRDRLA